MSPSNPIADQKLSKLRREIDFLNTRMAEIRQKFYESFLFTAHSPAGGSARCILISVDLPFWHATDTDRQIDIT
jgi:hypothetical protein